MGYSSNGLNLKYENLTTASSWNIYNISIAGFLTSDATYYTWQRTA